MNRYLIFLLAFLLGVLIYILTKGNNFSIGVNTVDDDDTSDCLDRINYGEDGIGYSFRVDKPGCTFEKIQDILNKALDDIPNITRINLYNCRLEKIPDLKIFNNLLSLNLSYNSSLNTEILTSDGISSKLNTNGTLLLVLDISNCNLTEIPYLKKLTSLSHLDLSYNDLSIINKRQDSEYVLSSDIPLNINKLNLSNCSLTKVPNLITFQELNSLDLSFNNLNINNFEKIGSRFNLNELVLINCNLTKIPNLSTYLKLNLINLSSNDLSKTTIYDLTNSIGDPSTINSLYLDNCSLTEVPNLYNFNMLELLYLSHNNFKKNIQTELNASSSINLLNLSNCNLTEMPNLSNLTYLNTLYLSDNDLSKIGPNEIQDNININVNNSSNYLDLYLYNTSLTRIPNLNKFTKCNVYLDDFPNIDICNSKTGNVNIYKKNKRGVDVLQKKLNCSDVFCKAAENMPDCTSNIDNGHVGYCFNYKDKTCKNSFKWEALCGGKYSSDQIWCNSSGAIEIHSDMEQLKELLTKTTIDISLYDHFKKLNPLIGKLLKYENENETHPIIFTGLTEIIKLGIVKYEEIGLLDEVGDNSDDIDRLTGNIIDEITKNPNLIKYINSTEHINICNIRNIMKNNTILFKLIKDILPVLAELDIYIFEVIRNYRCFNETDSNKCNTHDINKIIIIMMILQILEKTLGMKNFMANDEIDNLCESYCESCSEYTTMRTLCDEFLYGKQKYKCGEQGSSLSGYCYKTVRTHLGSSDGYYDTIDECKSADNICRNYHF